MQKFGTPDAENPEWTDDEIRAAKPGHEVFPPEFLAAAREQRRGRGPQKAPTKRLVSIRLDAHVVDAFKATGRGWQGLMNQALANKARTLGRQRAKSQRAKSTARASTARRRTVR